MTQRKLIKQKKATKDYKKKKNIINSWKDHVVSLIKRGAKSGISNPRVQFPKPKKYVKRNKKSN